MNKSTTKQRASGTTSTSRSRSGGAKPLAGGAAKRMAKSGPKRNSGR